MGGMRGLCWRPLHNPVQAQSYTKGESPEALALRPLSEIDQKNVEDYLEVGDKVKVHLLEIHDDGKMRLTRKPFVSGENGEQDG